MRRTGSRRSPRPTTCWRDPETRARASDRYAARLARDEGRGAPPAALGQRRRRTRRARGLRGRRATSATSSRVGRRVVSVRRPLRRRRHPPGAPTEAASGARRAAAGRPHDLHDRAAGVARRGGARAPTVEVTTPDRSRAGEGAPGIVERPHACVCAARAARRRAAGRPLRDGQDRRAEELHRRRSSDAYERLRAVEGSDPREAG